MLERSVVTIEGVRTPIATGGSKDAEDAVVFVHGNPGPSEDWDELAPRVAEFARVLTMDMPGYGRADRPKGFAYTLAGYAAHLEGVLEATTVRGVHLVAHDFGGPWALKWAAEHPDRVRSITLINTGVLIGYRWHKYARIWQTPLLGELFFLTSTETLLRIALNADNPKPLPYEFAKRVHSFADFGHARAVCRLYRACKPVDALSRALAPKLRVIDPPTLVIWGEEDPFLPKEFAQKQRDVFPAAEVHLLPGCGHWPFIDDLEAVSALLVPFLERHWARGSAALHGAATRA
jgi:pimeloyl-ACP methyl ester carboxylesterase